MKIEKLIEKKLLVYRKSRKWDSARVYCSAEEVVEKIQQLENKLINIFNTKKILKSAVCEVNRCKYGGFLNNAAMDCDFCIIYYNKNCRIENVVFERRPFSGFTTSRVISLPMLDDSLLYNINYNIL